MRELWPTGCLGKNITPQTNREHPRPMVEAP